MKQKIDSLPLPMGGTDGGLALNEAFNTLFLGKGKFCSLELCSVQLISNGYSKCSLIYSPGNPELYQNAIFLSDGNGGDPLSAAENFHKNGIRLTSVAIGAANQVLMRELTGMNRNPPLTYKNHYFEHNDANKLAEAAKDMKQQILSCQGIELSTKPGGYNIQTTASTALSTTTKDECKQVESKGLEIALIVDTSGR